MDSKKPKKVVDEATFTLLRFYVCGADASLASEQFRERLGKSDLATPGSVSAFVSRFRRSRRSELPPLNEENLNTLLEVLGIARKRFDDERKQLNHAIEIKEGGAAMRTECVLGANRHASAERLYGQKLDSYLVTLAPGDKCGTYAHSHAQPDNDPIPLGDETIILISGHARVHIRFPTMGGDKEYDEKPFNLMEPGHMLQFKSYLSHWGEWLSPHKETWGQLEEEGKSDPSDYDNTTLAVVRYPAKESNPPEPL